MSTTIKRLLALAGLLMSVVTQATAATPGLVNGSQGWYEDIRFMLPDTESVPTRVGQATPSPCAPFCSDLLTFNTLTAGRLEATGNTLSAPGMLDVIARPVVTQSTADWQGLGVDQDGLVQDNEALDISFPDTMVSLLGLSIVYSSSLPPPEITMLVGELPFTLQTAAPSSAWVVQGSLTALTPGVNQIQWWFEQPLETQSFTLLGSSTPYQLASVQIAAVPEPEAIALLMAGLVVVWGVRRR